MAAEDARMKAGLKTAEDELNLIKNQVQQTLLDIREHILDATNPFSAIDDALTDEDEIEFGDDLMGGGAGAAGAAGAAGESGDGDGGESSDDSDGPDDLLGENEGDEGEDDEFVDDGMEDPEDEFIEELPDDGYMGDEIIDDGMGGGMSSGMGSTEEIFEEEEIVPDEDEGFELDEEPSEEYLDLDEAADAAAADADGSVLGAGGVAAAMVADFDVLTMAGLVRWVAVTTERLGPNRTEILLDAFEAAGRIAPSTRAVLHHLMALSEEDPSEVVPVREIVSAMVRMEGVLDSNAGSDTSRLLSMLMDVDDDPMDRLLA